MVFSGAPNSKECWPHVYVIGARSGKKWSKYASGARVSADWLRCCSVRSSPCRSRVIQLILACPGTVCWRGGGVAGDSGGPSCDFDDSDRRREFDGHGEFNAFITPRGQFVDDELGVESERLCSLRESGGVGCVWIPARVVWSH